MIVIRVYHGFFPCSDKVYNNIKIITMNLSWIYLVVAGLFEIGWPLGMKMAQNPGKSIIGIMVSVICMALSGIFLFLAQKQIPIGTAYAIWTGIGAAGTFLVGIYLYQDPATTFRILGAFMILSGVVVLKIAH